MGDLSLTRVGPDTLNHWEKNLAVHKNNVSTNSSQDLKVYAVIHFWIVYFIEILTKIIRSILFLEGNIHEKIVLVVFPLDWLETLEKQQEDYKNNKNVWLELET